MNKKTKLGNSDTAWIENYRTDVVAAYKGIFEEAAGRFNDGEKLINRFKATIDSVLENGRDQFRSVDEAHNELCIAAAILENEQPKFTFLEYEPSLKGSDKTIDFRGTTDENSTIFIDVKTIKPLPKDRWDQFERAQKEGWLPANVQVILSEGWNGGEIWHSMFAARSRMLEYALELEKKISKGNLLAEKVFFILALCGDGFHWHQDELEDFVSYYFSGMHRPDDPFALAEQKFIQEKKLTLAKTISRFACMYRQHGDIRCKRLNWNVQPPRPPSFW